MTALVVEEGLAVAAGVAGAEGVVVVPRPSARRCRGRAPLDAGAAVAALERAGAGALVLARSGAADPGAAALPAMAAVMGLEVVLLPGDADAAAWVVAIAATLPPGLHPERRLQVLAGASASPVLPLRPVGAGQARMPAVRPGVLARWAGCAWRPCPRCGGGGLPGSACGRCGAGLASVGAR